MKNLSYILLTISLLINLEATETSGKDTYSNHINELKYKKKYKNSIKASAIVWQSKEGNLEYTAKVKSINPLDDELNQKIEIVIPDFGWRPGFKIEFSHNFSNDNWEAIANWTFYHGEFTHVKKHPNVELYPEYNGLIPFYYYNFLSAPLSPQPKYNHGTADWKVYFNSLDLALAKEFSVLKKCSIKLLSAIQTTLIRQNYKIYYTKGNRITNSIDDITLLESIIHFKNNSIGFGPKIAIETKYHMPWGFLLLADSSISALISKFSIKQDQKDKINDNLLLEIKEFSLILNDKFYSIKPVIGILLGFGWTQKIKKTFLEITLGYQMQYFFGQNQIKRFVEEKLAYSNNADLQLHGLTAGIKIGF